MANNSGIARIDGRETTMVFVWEDGVPRLAWHGSRLASGADLTILADSQRRPVLHASLDANEAISLHPEIGRGFLGHPAMIGNRASISAPGWAGRFRMIAQDRLEDGIVFNLADEERALHLAMTCRLDAESDVATFTNRLANMGDTPFDVDWLSAPVIAPGQEYDQHLSFHGRWCAEFDIERADIPLGLTKRENRRGRTSHEAFPGLVLLSGNTSDSQGACMGLHLGWSGNHRIILERLATGDIQIQAGILLFSGEMTLEPGEAMETPPLYVAHSADGLNAMSQKLHAHVRARVLKFPVPSKPRPVTVNTWEAIYFRHEHDALVELANAAADIGAERFVLDDGWFRGRNDDTSSLGDWYPDEAKYPDGLEPIASHVRSLGMEFGLWVEPEMVNPRSRLFEEHPDWALGLGQYPKLTGRNQLVLDLANPLVSDYLFERIGRLVEDHRIDYLKWDMNRDLVLPGDRNGKPTALRQTEALYALLDRLLAAFPGLEIESCASGGGRVDYGILGRTHRFWTSDSNDAVERMKIQTGFSHFLPPEVMGAHIGPQWSHTSGRGLHAGFRVLAASYGHMGVEADLRKMSDDERDIIRNAIARYKADREIWHSGNFSRITTVDPQLVGAAAVSRDCMRGRLVVTQLDRPRSTVPPRIRLAGLDPEMQYRVTLQFASEMVHKANRTHDNPLWGEGYVADGSTLAIVGITLPALYAQTGLAIAVNPAGETA
ncbi:MAG: alpha-galactosidase [Nitratireductor sp.]|nr:alpha-galactosidase [Nitratireductor sp.]